MDNTAYYIFALVLLIVVFLLIRKIASCLIKMVIMAILVAALAVVGQCVFLEKAISFCNSDKPNSVKLMTKFTEFGEQTQ